jgi:hypothetical protein
MHFTDVVLALHSVQTLYLDPAIESVIYLRGPAPVIYGLSMTHVFVRCLPPRTFSHSGRRHGTGCGRSRGKLSFAHLIVVKRFHPIRS